MQQDPSPVPTGYASHQPADEAITSGRIWRLCQKELRETLRDRRTIITLVLMPILVYPILSMALQRILLTTARTEVQAETFSIGVLDEATGANLSDAISIARRILRDPKNELLRVDREKSPASPLLQSLQGDPADKNQEEAERNFRISLITTDPVGVLEEGTIDLLVELVKEGDRVDEREKDTVQYAVTYRQDDLLSEKALREFQRLLQSVNDTRLRVFGKKLGIDSAAAFRMEAKPTGQKARQGSGLATIIPLVLLLMTITGAVYPAIDLTAGERERGTMESLIASPAPRILLLLSKYVAVVTVAVLTALANLLAMWITLSTTGIGKALIGSDGFSFVTVLQILPLLVIFACFFSAVLLALCSFAKSFKEAQAYLIPVMLFALTPGVLSLMPNVEFTTTLAIVPLVNIVLLSRDLMTHQGSVIPAFAAIVSTMIYAAAALSVAARLFGKDATSHGGEGNWSDLLKRPRSTLLRPRVDHLFVFMAVLFPIYFVTTSLVGQFSEWTLSQRSWANAALTAILFGLLPWLFSVFQRFDIRTTFLLGDKQYVEQQMVTGSVANAMTLIVGLLSMSTSLWMGAHELFVLSEWLHLATLSEEQIQFAQGIKDKFRSIPLVVIWLTMALIPAIFEEFFFRGFVLSSFEKMSRIRAIIMSSLIFGAFHVLTANTLALERFLPTAFLGLVLGWIAVRTNRLWPGIVIHTFHNGLLYSVAYYGDEIKAWGLGLDEQKNLPISWLGTGALLLSIGIGCIFFATRKRAASTTGLTTAP